MANAVKAIALCRVSTKKQEEDGNLDPQKENVEKAADVLNARLPIARHIASFEIRSFGRVASK